MTLRLAVQRHGPAGVIGALAGAALMTVAFANATPGTLNSVTLDNGTCGHNLQLGSDSTASSSAAPWFLLYGDGGAASYSLFIDGASIGTYHTTDIYGHVCVADPVPLADGPHTLTGNETSPHAYTVPAFTFSVDTAAPTVPTITSITVATPNTSCRSGLQIRGTSDPRVTIRVYNGPLGLGGAASDFNGNWYAATLGLSSGTYNVTAVTLDQAGNVSARSAAKAVTVPPCASPSASAIATARPSESPTPTPTATLPPPTATPAPTPVPTPTPCGT